MKQMKRNKQQSIEGTTVNKQIQEQIIISSHSPSASQYNCSNWYDQPWKEQLNHDNQQLCTKPFLLAKYDSMQNTGSHNVHSALLSSG